VSAAAALAAVLTLLAGCTSIPLSTLAAFSTFDEADFARLDPDALRVRVAVPAGYALDMEGVRLRARVESAAQSRTDSFELATVDERDGTRGAGWLSKGTPVVVTTARLSERSKERFRALQRFVGAGPAQAIDLDVTITLRAVPEGATTARAWVDLLLRPEQGYFTLIDGAAVAIPPRRTRR
jgi:hypothetical protein